ncbi:hypothetical protein BKA70DRAFT_1239033 [Coprinopsis sp. MPI-PUGE-AT-0042]|nr:hypothetical protein BKA70DRAFT_1239033 [Coprinopsis sp. MPI-PUGE-AT-0042]
MTIVTAELTLKPDEAFQMKMPQQSTLRAPNQVEETVHNPPHPPLNLTHPCPRKRRKNARNESNRRGRCWRGRRRWLQGEEDGHTRKTILQEEEEDTPISVTSLELERKADARMVKEGHGVLEQAMSMVKEHQQRLATDGTYWKLRIDELKKTHPLKFAKFIKKKKFRNDCNTLPSEDCLSSPLYPHPATNHPPNASPPVPPPMPLHQLLSSSAYVTRKPMAGHQRRRYKMRTYHEEQGQSSSAAPPSKQQQMMTGVNRGPGGANLRRHESLSVPPRSGGSGARQVKRPSSSRSQTKGYRGNALLSGCPAFRTDVANNNKNDGLSTILTDTETNIAFWDDKTLIPPDHTIGDVTKAIRRAAQKGGLTVVARMSSCFLFLRRQRKPRYTRPSGVDEDTTGFGNDSGAMLGRPRSVAERPGLLDEWWPGLAETDTLLKSSPQCRFHQHPTLRGASVLSNMRPFPPKQKHYSWLATTRIDLLCLLTGHPSSPPNNGGFGSIHSAFTFSAYEHILTLPFPLGAVGQSIGHAVIPCLERGTAEWVRAGGLEDDDEKRVVELTFPSPDVKVLQEQRRASVVAIADTSHRSRANGIPKGVELAIALIAVYFAASKDSEHKPQADSTRNLELS